MLIVIGSAFSQILAVKDDFSGTTFSDNWYVCNRDENRFAIVRPPGINYNVAQMTVNPRSDLGPFALLAHAGCRSADSTSFQPGTDERAELWEADRLKLPFGSEIWYSFEMWIDSTIDNADNNRLVIGQWKEDGGHSPMIAQRFVNRQFTITVEQDNDVPDSAAAGDTDCRTYVAHDAAFGLMAAATTTTGTDRTPFARLLRVDRNFYSASIPHDAYEVVHTPLENLTADQASCARDLTVEQHNLLPDSFGRWTKMIYHFKATSDSNGFLDVWANDLPIVTVKGRIGFRDHVNDQQYFKFGPYRNHVSYTTTVLLANYARGSTRSDVERR